MYVILWNFRQYGAKAYVLSFPEEGDGRTDARTHARTNNQLRAQPSGEMHENKSAASAGSPDYIKFEAVIKSAASAASLRGGRASGRLDHGNFFAIVGRGQKIAKNSQNLRLRVVELAFERLRICR